jgi:hypothetical protein
MRNNTFTNIACTLATFTLQTSTPCDWPVPKYIEFNNNVF